ncbi:hypothetical protein [Streptomyces sp. ADI91-18]|uniref:hypothetical protein n=1 Tax=Streptomyces sp. ADI91-18 TaxID=1522755 RepID=UPI0013DDD9A2|nr:hypothetical protein [Streptomyces sp. ADI91-18]
MLAQLRDALILVLLGAVVSTLAIGDHADAVVIALVIVVNTSVGVAQEVRADNAVAALSAPNARVLRDSAPGEVPAAEIVPGDVSQETTPPRHGRSRHASDCWTTTTLRSASSPGRT